MFVPLSHSTQGAILKFFITAALADLSYLRLSNKSRCSITSAFGRAVLEKYGRRKVLVVSFDVCVCVCVIRKCVRVIT